MARSLRVSPFRRRDELAEDVNPSAGLVNLADCMLVLACGFMVAMMVYWNIDVANVEELQKESLEEVAPEDMLEDLQSGGAYYVEAGIVYQDPNTGQLWMVRKESGSDGGSAETNESETAPPQESGGEPTQPASSGDAAGNTGGAPSRAEGAD